MRVPGLTIKRTLRSLDLLRRYGTVRKIENAARAEWEYRRGRVRLKARPYLFRTDPGTHCTLACPYCGRTYSPPQPAAQLSLDEFVRGFEPFAPWSLLVSFQMFGEPTINPDLSAMVRHAHQAGAGTYVSTNLQAASEKTLADLLNSGLDLLTVALDAATKETYEEMKPGGDYDRLLGNLEFIFRRKRSIARPPAIGFQVLVTRKNEKELPQIRRMALDRGADYLDFKPTYLPGLPDWVPVNPKYRFDRYVTDDVRCSMPWTSLTLLADGAYFPCCAYPGDFRLEAATGDPLKSVWNGPALQEIRRGIAQGDPAALCRGCSVGRFTRF